MAGAKWSAMDPLAALSSGEEDSSLSASSDDEGDDESEPTPGSGKVEAVDDGDAEKKTTKKARRLDYEALSRHGYTGGLSIMHVPAPTQDAGDQDWLWSSGKRKGLGDAAEQESIALRERTREAIGEEAELAAARAVAAYNLTKKQKRDAIAEQKAVSFAQKEKRKREMGQASRGKNYVEEEKRLLRDSGAAGERIEAAVVTVYEEDCNATSTDLVARVKESFYHEWIPFDYLATYAHHGRLEHERDLGLKIENLVACEGVHRIERSESKSQWSQRLRRMNSRTLSISDDVVTALPEDGGRLRGRVGNEARRRHPGSELEGP